MSSEARFRGLFDAHYSGVARYVLARGFQAADADDLIAATFEVAWRRLDTLAEPPLTQDFPSVANWAVSGRLPLTAAGRQSDKAASQEPMDQRTLRSASSDPAAGAPGARLTAQGSADSGPDSCAALLVANTRTRGPRRPGVPHCWQRRCAVPRVGTLRARSPIPRRESRGCRGGPRRASSLRPPARSA
jgi:hypothetical protein